MSKTEASLLHCGLCQSMYRQPRTLRCLHSFCHPCLQQLSDRTRDKTTLQCPQCKHKITLPPDGVSGLILNAFLARMSQEYVQEVRRTLGGTGGEVLSPKLVSPTGLPAPGQFQYPGPSQRGQGAGSPRGVDAQASPSEGSARKFHYPDPAPGGYSYFASKEFATNQQVSSQLSDLQQASSQFSDLQQVSSQFSSPQQASSLATSLSISSPKEEHQLSRRRSSFEAFQARGMQRRMSCTPPEVLRMSEALQQKLNDLQSASLRISYSLESVTMAESSWQQKKQDLKRDVQRRTAELQFFIKRQERLLMAVLDSRDTDRALTAAADRARADLRTNLKAMVHEAEVVKSVLDMAADEELLSLGALLLEGSGVTQKAVSMDIPELRFQVPGERSVEDMMSRDFGSVVSGALTQVIFSPEDSQENLPLVEEEGKGKEKQSDDDAFVTETFVIDTTHSAMMPAVGVPEQKTLNSLQSGVIRSSETSFQNVSAQESGNAAQHVTSLGSDQNSAAQGSDSIKTETVDEAETEIVTEEEVVEEEKAGQDDDETFVTETFVIETPYSLTMPAGGVHSVPAQSSINLLQSASAGGSVNALQNVPAQEQCPSVQSVTSHSTNHNYSSQGSDDVKTEIIVEEVVIDEDVINKSTDMEMSNVEEEEQTQENEKEEEESEEEMIVEEVLEYVNGKMQVISKVTRPAPKTSSLSSKVLKIEDSSITKTEDTRTTDAGRVQNTFSKNNDFSSASGSLRSERGRGTDVRRTANSSAVSSTRQPWTKTSASTAGQQTPPWSSRQQQSSVGQQLPQTSATTSRQLAQPSFSPGTSSVITTQQQLTQSSVTSRQQPTSSTTTTATTSRPETAHSTSINTRQQPTQSFLTTTESSQQITHTDMEKQEPISRTESQGLRATRPTQLQRQEATRTDPKLTRPSQLHSAVTTSSVRIDLAEKPGSGTTQETGTVPDTDSREPASMKSKLVAQKSEENQDKGSGNGTSEHLSTLSKFQDFRESLKQRRRELLESSLFSGPALSGHPAVAHLLSRERRVQSLDRTASLRNQSRRSSSPAAGLHLPTPGDPAPPPSLHQPRILSSSSTRSSDSDDSVAGGGGGGGEVAEATEGVSSSTPPASPQDKSGRPVRRAVSAASDRATKMEFLRETWRKRKELLIQNEAYVRGHPDIENRSPGEDASGSEGAGRARSKERVRSRVSSLTEALKKSGQAEEGALELRTSGKTLGGSPDFTTKARPGLQAEWYAPQVETPAEAQVLRTVDMILQKKNLPVASPQLSPREPSPLQPSPATSPPPTLSPPPSSFSSPSPKPSMVVRPRPREPSPVVASGTYAPSAPLETLPEDEGKTSPERKPGLRTTSPPRAGAGGENKLQPVGLRANIRRKKERWRSLSLT